MTQLDPATNLNRLDSGISISIASNNNNNNYNNYNNKSSGSSARLEDLLASLNDFSVGSARRSSISSTDAVVDVPSRLRIDTAQQWRRDSAASSNTASPGSSFRRSRSVTGRRDSTDATPTMTPTTYDPNTGLDTPVTLELLQSTTMVLSGFLDKLQPNADVSGSRWKQRFVLLTEDGTLYIFRSNGSAQATPLTLLPVTGCSSYQDVDEGAWILRVSGDSRRERRSWTFRVDSDAMLRTWLQSIHRSISSSDGDVSGTPTRAITIAGYANRSTSVPRAGSYSESLYGSTVGSSSTSFRSVARCQPLQNSVNSEERDAQMKAMHQQYLISQKAAAEQFALRKEAEVIVEAAESDAQCASPVAAGKVARKASVSKAKKQRPMMSVSLDYDMIA
ncbi:hypothetical protein HDU78_006357 [Chytriomyces hyalinus]|nr:hypothetical protein HDU78_006357 [Chytriomyces hyalinus]